MDHLINLLYLLVIKLVHRDITVFLCQIQSRLLDNVDLKLNVAYSS